MQMKGLTIIEVVVALAAGIVVLTALTYITLSSLNNARQGASRSMATQYAEQGLEVVRSMKENNFTSLSSLPSNSYCLAASCSAITATAGTCGPKVSSCPVNVANTFVREVNIRQADGNCTPSNPIAGRSYIKAIATVAYGDGKCTSSSNRYCHSVVVESCFSNFDTRVAP